MRESGAITARESIPDAKEFPPAGQAAILLAAVLTSIDSFIVNVSLPSIQSSLGRTPSNRSSSSVDTRSSTPCFWSSAGVLGIDMDAGEFSY